MLYLFYIFLQANIARCNFHGVYVSTLINSEYIYGSELKAKTLFFLIHDVQFN
jgi:hypothetical protein